MRTRSQQDSGKSREKHLAEKVKDLEQQITQILKLQTENAELKLLVCRGKVETKSFSSQTDEGTTSSYSSAGSVVSQAGFHIFLNQFSVSDLDVIS